MKLIGQAVEVGSARHVRVEVLVDRPSKKSGDPPTVFVTKYMDGQIGQQSIGMTLEAARTVAICCNARSNDTAGAGRIRARTT